MQSYISQNRQTNPELLEEEPEIRIQYRLGFPTGFGLISARKWKLALLRGYEKELPQDCFFCFLAEVFSKETLVKYLLCCYGRVLPSAAVLIC